MSGADIRKTAYQASLPWRTLALALAVPIGILGATVLIVPSWVSPKPVGGQLPQHPPAVPGRLARHR